MMENGYEILINVKEDKITGKVIITYNFDEQMRVNDAVSALLKVNEIISDKVCQLGKKNGCDKTTIGEFSKKLLFKDLA